MTATRHISHKHGATGQQCVVIMTYTAQRLRVAHPI